MKKVETTIVPMRLTPTEIDELDRIVSVGNFKSRSHAIRDALYQLMTAHGIRPQTGIEIDDERKRCRPRRATLKPRNIAKDLRKPSTVAAPVKHNNGKANRRKKGGSKVA